MAVEKERKKPNLTILPVLMKMIIEIVIHMVACYCVEYMKA